MSSFSYFVGQRIKKYRKSRGYTIEQFSAMINKSKATLSKYENGAITIDIETLYDIAQALEIDLRCFIDYQPPVFHQDTSLPKNNYFNQSLAYMYYYDGRVRQMVRSLLRFSRAADRETIEVTLYLGVASFSEPDRCQHLFTGEMKAYDTITHMVMTNQINEAEKMYICMLNPMSNRTPAIGLVSGIGSTPFFAPIALKALISKEPLDETERLMNTIKLDKDDYHLLRYYNMTAKGCEGYRLHSLFSAHAQDLPAEPQDDALFQPGDIGLGDAQPVCHLLLGQLSAAPQPKPHGDDVPFAGAQLCHRLRQHLAVCVRLDGTHDHVAVRTQHIAEQQLLAVPVGVQRLVEADLHAAAAVLPQVHEYLVFDAAGGVGGQLDILVGTKRVDGLDQPDGADGDQVLDVDAGVLKAAGNVHHQPQIPLDEGLPHRQLASVQPGQQRRLLVPGQRRRQGVAAADIHDLIRPAESAQKRPQTVQQCCQHVPSPPPPPDRPTGRGSRRRR